MRITQDNQVRTNKVMDNIIIQALLKLQNNKCLCGNDINKYQLHHLRYGIDITLYDLCLLCPSCHANKHDRLSNTSTLRIMQVCDTLYKSID